MSGIENPSAFPLAVPGDCMMQPDYGMSLRDWFAGQALASIMQDKAIWDSTPDEEREIAGRLYRWADAMLAERSKA